MKAACELQSLRVFEKCSEGLSSKLILNVINCIRYNELSFLGKIWFISGVMNKRRGRHSLWSFCMRSFHDHHYHHHQTIEMCWWWWSWQWKQTLEMWWWKGLRAVRARIKCKNRRFMWERTSLHSPSLICTICDSQFRKPVLEQFGWVRLIVFRNKNTQTFCYKFLISWFQTHSLTLNWLLIFLHTLDKCLPSKFKLAISCFHPKYLFWERKIAIRITED